MAAGNGGCVPCRGSRMASRAHGSRDRDSPTARDSGRALIPRSGRLDRRALLDWPLEWQDFSVEPKRVFALDDSRAVVIAVRRGRSRTMGVEVEAEIVWLFSFRDERVRRWDKFMTLDAALEAAASS